MKKRVLALVVSLAMITSTMTMAYANTPEMGQNETSVESVVEAVDISTESADAAEDTGGTEDLSDTIPTDDIAYVPDVSEMQEISDTSGVYETAETYGPEGTTEAYETDKNNGDTVTGEKSSDISSINESSESEGETDDLSNDTKDTSESSDTSEVSGEAEEEAAEPEPEADLGLDGSQVRLFVGTPDPSILDQAHILSGYNGLYILAYGSAEEAAAAYSRLSAVASFIAYDRAVITVADIDDVSNEVQTEASNAVAELAEAPSVWGGGMIALIDTGANSANVVYSVSMLGDDPSDDNGHGTRMAALIAEQSPGAAILSIKAFDSSGHASSSTLYTAIRYAIDANVSVINLSVSGFATADTAPIAAILNEAIASGITVIGAAGNNGMDAAYTIPGAIGGAIIAGSANGDGARASFSNYGGTVDWYVVSGSTSEAAAILSGIYTREGAIGADKETVFVPGYDPLKDGDYEWRQLSSEEIDARFGVVRDGFDVAETVYLNISQNGWAAFDTVEAPILYAGGNLAQCTVASAPLPNGQTLAFNKVTIDSSSSEGLQLLSKALHYGNDNFGLAHFAVSYIAAFYLGIGRTDLWHVTSPTYGLQLSASGQATVINWVNSLASQPNVSGTLYYTSTAYSGSGVQDVAFGSFTASGRITVHKNAGQTVFEPSLEGAAYNMYRTYEGAQNSDLNTYIATFRTGDNGLVTSVYINGEGETTGEPPVWGTFAPGTYYIKEELAPAGYLIDPNIYTVELAAGEDEVVYSTDQPAKGYLQAVKTSADPALTNGNSCYSLEGAVFAVFTSRDSARSAWQNPENDYTTYTEYKGTLTTDANGLSNKLQLDPATYYVAEVKAPKGFARDLNVRAVQVTAGNTETLPAQAEFSDTPLSDPVSLLLVKKDAKTGEEVRRVG